MASPKHHCHLRLAGRQKNHRRKDFVDQVWQWHMSFLFILRGCGSARLQGRLCARRRGKGFWWTAIGLHHECSYPSLSPPRLLTPDLLLCTASWKVVALRIGSGLLLVTHSQILMNMILSLCIHVWWIPWFTLHTEDWVFFRVGAIPRSCFSMGPVSFPTPLLPPSFSWDTELTQTHTHPRPLLLKLIILLTMLKRETVMGVFLFWFFIFSVFCLSVLFNCFLYLVLKVQLTGNLKIILNRA